MESERKAATGGHDRISTKAKLADELVVLGKVLVRARESKRLKQSELATRLDVPASYLSKIENGTRRLDAIELVRIAEAIGCDPAEIVRELQSELQKRLRTDVPTTW